MLIFSLLLAPSLLSPLDLGLLELSMLVSSLLRLQVPSLLLPSLSFTIGTTTWWTPATSSGFWLRFLIGRCGYLPLPDYANLRLIGYHGKLLLLMVYLGWLDLGAGRWALTAGSVD